jgi:3-deoxy-D-manno-octulosonic-acid transferase
MMRALYSLTGIALTPLIRLWLTRRAARGKEVPARMGERFGYASTPRPVGPLIWFHAASVGETQSVLTLMRSLLVQHPALHILITTGTVTSAALVAQQNIPRVIHQFIPVDTHHAVRRFLAHWQPSLALWVESEFWPQLLWQTHARGVPMLLINARMSQRSFDGWQRFPRLIRSLLACFTAAYAGAPEDAARLRALGAADVREVGNLKYDAAPLPVDDALLAELTRATAGRRIWVAASTHANEEQMIAEVQQRLREEFPELLCILIPRHATRGDAIAADLAANRITAAQRSKGEPILAATDIYLADTMGELGTFYSLTDLVFLGGSLVAVGGHNPLEPARFGAAILTGAQFHNFTTIMQHLLQHDALRVVQQKSDLIAALRILLTDDAARKKMAENAAAIVAASRGASEHIAQHIAALLPAEVL